MTKFSDRYGYTTQQIGLISETMPKEIANAICSIFDELKEYLQEISSDRVYRHYRDQGLQYYQIEQYVWVHFLHKRKSDFNKDDNCLEVITEYILSSREWYEKLNLLEFIICFLFKYVNHSDSFYKDTVDSFILKLNNAFIDLHYAYRIIDNLVVPITNSLEIEAVELAFENNSDNVHLHIETALKHFARRPEPDYRNSIKESISAVECLYREITGESTLDKAIPKMKALGIVLNPQFEEGIKRMYYYTNDKRTGIRHSLLCDTHNPTAAEAKYMLVICSALINYIRMLI